jgi:hypothetical protein
MAIWERYEDAARDAIGKVKEYLNLQKLESEKKKYQGDINSWEIEISGYQEGDGRLAVFECRRRGRNIQKGEMGAFEHEIRDLGAKGYIVSEKGLSKGAKKIAEHHEIVHIPFNWDPGTEDYVLKILNQIFAKVTMSAIASVSVKGTVT